MRPPDRPVYGDFVLSTLEPWGRIDESIETLQTALEADPLSMDLRNVLSRIQLSAGQFDAALANCGRVVAEDPDFPFAEEYCARALAAKGRTDEALALFNKRPSYDEHGIGYVYAITGRRAEAERLALQNPRRAGAYLRYPELTALRGDPESKRFVASWASTSVGHSGERPAVWLEAADGVAQDPAFVIGVTTTLRNITLP